MKLFRTTIGVWILLFFLFLPFPYSVLPNFGEALAEFIFPIIQWTGSLMGVEITEMNFHSDSIHLYVQLTTLFVISLGIAIAFLRIKLLDYDRMQLLLQTAVSYTLAFFLIKYGGDKLFKYQFYDAAPNTLFTPTGYLTKDILFWTSMGSSYSYNIFMGLIEIIPGLLLFWNRTRMLGALIALGVLGNVLALNFGFDITVKILSTMLVIASAFVLVPYRNRLWSFFVQNGAAEKVEPKELIKKQVLKRALKGFIVALLLIESLFVYITAEAWNGDNQAKIAHHGSYDMELFSGTSTEFNVSAIKRLHIHNSGYLIVENKKGTFKDYKIHLSPSKDKLFFNNSSLEISIKSGKYTTTFSSSTEQNSFELITKKIDLERLPLRSDSFHWTVESFMEE